MVIANRTVLSGLLRAACILCAALPASAAVQVAQAPQPPVEQPAAQPAEPAKPTLGWLEQPLPGQQLASQETLPASLSAPSVMLHTSAAHIGRQREDRDLTANDSAIARYDLKNDEPILSEDWWQALPGIGVALFLGLMLYMRHPIQRKRKYRRTPHEPTGAYKRRHRHF